LLALRHRSALAKHAYVIYVCDSVRAADRRMQVQYKNGFLSRWCIAAHFISPFINKSFSLLLPPLSFSSPEKEEKEEAYVAQFRLPVTRVSINTRDLLNPPPPLFYLVHQSVTQSFLLLITMCAFSFQRTCLKKSQAIDLFQMRFQVFIVKSKHCFPCLPILFSLLS